MKKILFIIFISFFVVFLVAGIYGYILFRKATSDEAIRNRLLNSLQSFGEIEIGHAHLDILDGIIIDDITLNGGSDILQDKTININKLVLKYNHLSLLKGQFNISNIVVINPELIVEKTISIWALLNELKEIFEKAELPVFTDVLQHGVEMRNLKLWVKKDPKIEVSGINIKFLPYAGSFENIKIRGRINDARLGNYAFSMRYRPYVPHLDVELNANNLMMNKEFLARFPLYGEELWDEYKPNGKVNVSCSASFDNKDNQEKTDYNIHLHLNSLDLFYKPFAFPVHNVNGDVELSDEKLFLRDIIGYIKSGNYTSQLNFNGSLDLFGPKNTLVLNVPNLFINQELLKKFPQIDEQLRSEIQPTGLADVTFQYNKVREQKDNFFLVVDCKGVDVSLPGIPFPLLHVNGQIKVCNDIMLFKNIVGFLRCGEQPVFTEISGIYDTKSTRNNFYVRIPDLNITKDILLNTLPDKETVRKIWKILKPRGKVGLFGNFQGYKEEKKNEFSLEVDLKDCEITNEKYKLFLWGIGGLLEINNEQFRGRHIDAKCCGGNVEGTIWVKTEVQPYRYEGTLNFSRIILEEFVKKLVEEEKPWTGLLDGRIQYHGSGSNIKDFQATGQINVTNGYLSEVPIILSIFNFLNLQFPQKESFRSARVKFEIKDGEFHIIEGKISSDSVEVVGKGTISFEGNLDLTVVTGISKGTISKLPIVGKLYDFIVGGVRKQLTVVEIKGTFLEPKSHLVPFKPFTQSIKSLFDILPEAEKKRKEEEKKAETAAGTE